MTEIHLVILLKAKDAKDFWLSPAAEGQVRTAYFGELPKGISPVDLLI